MYCCSKKSRNKIIHLQSCFHLQHTEPDDIGWFETLPEAYAQGYSPCKHCSQIARQYRRESKEIVDFCRKNGLAVYLGRWSITVTSPRSTWKIAVGGNMQLALYHQNTYETARDHLSEIKGYHLQGDVSCLNVVDYLKYIIEHDFFRMLNPVSHRPKKKEPPRKGTKRYRREQQKMKNREKRQAIRSVLNLIESLNIPQTETNQAAAM